MSGPAQPVDVPEHVRATIDAAMTALESRLLRLYQLRAPFRLWAEMHGEGGELRSLQWYEDVRQQIPQAPRPKASDPPAA